MARARINGRSNTELSAEITEAVRSIKQSGTRSRASQPHRQENGGRAGDADALERVREAWRRLEALGDPLGLRDRNGAAPAAPSTDPTPERLTKALGLGRRLVGRREVRKIRTTLDVLEEHHHLPRHLRIALDRYCEVIAIAMSVCAVDEQTGSSARLVSGYSDAPLIAYGSRDVSEHVLEARKTWKILERELPLEMRDIVEQLVSEETGLLQGRPQSSDATRRLVQSLHINDDSEVEVGVIETQHDAV